MEEDWLQLLGESQVEDSPEEAKDLLKMILFLTILDSAIFITISLSSSVRKWIARRRARCLFILLSSFVLALLSSLVALCSLARWQVRALVSPCTREMELWQRIHSIRERTIFGRGFFVTGILLIFESLTGFTVLRKVRVL